MITSKELHSFSEYVLFVGEHIPGWRGYVTGGPKHGIKLEEVLGAPKHFPCKVSVRWVVLDDDESPRLIPQFGIIQDVPTFIPFETKD